MFLAFCSAVMNYRVHYCDMVSESYAMIFSGGAVRYLFGKLYDI